MTDIKFNIKPLSPVDRKKLSKQYIYLFGFLIVVSILFFFVYKFVITPDKFTTIPIILFSVFGLLFSAVISYVLWSTYIDLKNGIKYCYIGFVTDKRINTHTSSTNRFKTKSGNNSRRTSTKTDYSLSIDNKEFSVSYFEYNKAVVGNKVYLELSPKKKEILAFTILEKNQESIKTNFKEINSIPYQISNNSQPMNKEEVEVVKRIFLKKLRTQLIFIAAYTLLLFLLWQGIFIFLIPVIVVFVYASFKLLIELNQYAKYRRNGKLKQITSVQVLDKLKITSNRSATKFRLITNSINADVSEKIYNKIQPNDIIGLHTASLVSILIAVSFDSDSMYILNHEK